MKFQIESNIFYSKQLVQPVAVKKKKEVEMFGNGDIQQENEFGCRRVG